MEPLESQEAPMVVVDLSRVGYFGSVFLFGYQFFPLLVLPALALACVTWAAAASPASPLQG